MTEKEPSLPPAKVEEEEEKEDDDAPPPLEKLLKDYPNLKRSENGLRIKCAFTNHEMPVNLKAVKQYIDGKKYKNYLANPTFDFDQYAPHLQPVVTPGSGKLGGKEGTGKNNSNHKQLYCQLTARLINRDPVHVLKHVQGYRYVREKRKYEECHRKGVPYVAPVRSKQKNAKNRDDDADDAESEDEALDVKKKKFSKNPEISDSEEEEDEAVADDLEDLYPPEDFEKEADVDVRVGAGVGADTKKEIDGNAADSSLSEDDDDDDSSAEDRSSTTSTSSDEEKEKRKKGKKLPPGFKGKIQSPSKRKFSNGLPSKRFTKKMKKK